MKLLIYLFSFFFSIFHFFLHHYPVVPPTAEGTSVPSLSLLAVDPQGRWPGTHPAGRRYKISTTARWCAAATSSLIPFAAAGVRQGLRGPRVPPPPAPRAPPAASSARATARGREQRQEQAGRAGKSLAAWDGELPRLGIFSERAGRYPEQG